MLLLLLLLLWKIRINLILTIAIRVIGFATCLERHVSNPNPINSTHFQGLIQFLSFNFGSKACLRSICFGSLKLVLNCSILNYNLLKILFFDFCSVFVVCHLRTWEPFNFIVKGYFLTCNNWETERDWPSGRADWTKSALEKRKEDWSKSCWFGPAPEIRPNYLPQLLKCSIILVHKGGKKLNYLVEIF